MIAKLKAMPTGTVVGSSSALASLRPRPSYSEASSQGLSTQTKALLGAGALWILYRANAQATSKDWIVDLSLDVLQAAWLISYLSFLPFRSIALSLRGLAPHTSTPLNALRPALAIK